MFKKIWKILADKSDNKTEALVQRFNGMTIFEAITSVTEQRPYIQCNTQALNNIKLRPIDGINKCEVYLDGNLINSNYDIARYELQERWSIVS